VVVSFWATSCASYHHRVSRQFLTIAGEFTARKIGLLKPDLSRFGINFAFGRKPANDPRRNDAVQPRAGCRNVLRSWFKRWVRAALLVIAGAGPLLCARGQQAAENGSLAGSLTDLHSAPLANVTLTLRNTETGAAQYATTSHSGKYRFAALPAGEYTLIASGAEGTGRVDGIYVVSGHELQVRIAVEMKAAPVETAAQPSVRSLSSQIALERASRIRERLAAVPPVFPIATPPLPEIRIPAQALVSLPVPVAVASLGPNPAPIEPALAPAAQTATLTVVPDSSEQIEPASSSPQSRWPVVTGRASFSMRPPKTQPPATSNARARRWGSNPRSRLMARASSWHSEVRETTSRESAQPRS